MKEKWSLVSSTKQ